MSSGLNIYERQGYTRTHEREADAQVIDRHGKAFKDLLAISERHAPFEVIHQAARNHCFRKYRLKTCVKSRPGVA